MYPSDGSVVSVFKVEETLNNLADPTDYSTDDRVILANGTPDILTTTPTSAEAGGDITGDVIYNRHS